MSIVPGVINTGRNSGYQAIGLAYHFGAGKIVLVGFDMQHTGGKSHFHGDHPPHMRNACDVASWVPNFDKLAEDLKREGVDVVNCTLETALTQFRMASLDEELSG